MRRHHLDIQNLRMADMDRHEFELIILVSSSPVGQAKRVQRRKSFSAFRCAIFSLSISLSESLAKKAMPTLFAS